MAWKISCRGTEVVSKIKKNLKDVLVFEDVDSVFWNNFDGIYVEHCLSNYSLFWSYVAYKSDSVFKLQT